MPTFYFDVDDGQKAIYDEFGAELPDLEEAADEAAALLPEFARETLPDREAHGFAAAVRDEGGSVVYRAVLLFQGRRTTDGDKPYVTAVSDARRQLDRKAALMAEAQALKDRLARNVESLLTTFEELKAQVEKSQKAMTSYGPAGLS